MAENAQDPKADKLSIWDHDHPIWKIAEKVVTVVTLLVVAYTGRTVHNNQDKVDKIESRQDEAAVKQDIAAAKTTAVKEALDKKHDNEVQATRIQLWSAWKYLEEIAKDSASPSDQIKAAEAKKTYEDFVHQNPR